jgi:hypothetical protein
MIIFNKIISKHKLFIIVKKPERTWSPWEEIDSGDFEPVKFFTLGTPVYHG